MTGPAREAERTGTRVASVIDPAPSGPQQLGSAGLAIETSGLTKRFGRHLAVNGVDLAVPSGSVFGFLGPNGSGKTTSIRVLLGLAAATEGRVSMLGEPMPSGAAGVLPRVGALVEGPAFYPFLSGAANLRRIDSADRQATRADRQARVEYALERVGLTAAADKRVRAYSLGMKQRLGIAAALLRPRKLLVLDEPTNGLDPQGTREVRGLIRSLASDGTTVFVSSHLLAEVEQICTHVGVMSSGRLVAQGTLDELRRAGRSRVRVVTPDVRQAADVLERHGLELLPLPSAGNADVLTADLLDDGRPVAPESLVAELVAAGVRVRGFSVDEATLEERFVALTGEGFDVAS